MSQTKWNSEIRELFRQTEIRYPHQLLEPETKKAYLQDWRDEVDRVGFKRFEEGVKGARAYSEFFPMIAKIKKFIPEPRQDNEALRRELADLKRRKAAGEKFYTLADVFKGFCDKVEAGKIKGRDESGQRALQQWAKNLRGSEARYAAKLLAAEESEKKRPKSDFQSAHETLLGSSAQAERLTKGE